MLSIQKKELSTKKNIKTKTDTSSGAKKSTVSSSSTTVAVTKKKKKKKSEEEKVTSETNHDKKRKSSASSTKTTISSKTTTKKGLTKKLSDENLKKQQTKNTPSSKKNETLNQSKPKIKKKKSTEKLTTTSKPQEKPKQNDINKIKVTKTTVNNDVTNKPPRPTVDAQKPPTDPNRPSVFKHQDSINLYKKGYGSSRNLIVTKSSTDVMEKNQAGRPVFHLNLNDSTASFLGNSPVNGPSYLEMSSGLLPHHPQNKYNFKISLDDTNDVSQTANMLRDYIFDDDDEWNSSRTEPAHLQKNHEIKSKEEISLLDEEAFNQEDVSLIIPSTENTNRSFGMPGRSSTRLSFLFNKNTGLLCKNCFSSTCNHMDKFNTLATPKLKKVFGNSESSDLYPNNDSTDDQLLGEPNNLMDITNESMRLIDIASFNHNDTSSGEQTVFRQINMEYETQFETSTPNEDPTNYSSINPPEPTNNNVLNLSGSMLRYTPGIMNQNSTQQNRPKTNESLKYDSDYDDDSYLKACETTSGNNTFETLDINSGVLFYNIEQSEKQPSSSSSPSNFYQQQAPPENKKLKSRRVSAILMPDLPTVFEEKSAPNSAAHLPEESTQRSELEEVHAQQTELNEAGLQDLLNAVTDNLASMFDGNHEPDSLENSADEEIVKTDLTESEGSLAKEKQCESVGDVSDFKIKNTNKISDKEQKLSTEEEHIEPDYQSENKKDKENEEQIDCPTPLEKQGIFKRINDDEDEEKKYDKPLNEDELQAWLQANRKFTFEKDHFDHNELNIDALDSDDKEVLEINTPQWAESRTEKKKQPQNEQKSTKVDASTQSDLPSPTPVIHQVDTDDLTRPTSTAGSSDLPKTQGSYRHIDLLVLDRSRDQRVVQENRVFEIGVADMDVRDADSGVHSVNTERSDATPAIAPPVLNEGRHYEIIEEPLDELDEEGGINVVDEEQLPGSSSSSFLPPPLDSYQERNDQDIANDINNLDHNNDFHLPAINNNLHSRHPPGFYDRETFYENQFGNRLVLSHPSSSPYYYPEDFDDADLIHPSPRDIVSPILEHHMKMAQYHKERVALLTPLYSRSNMIDHHSRHVLKPKPPSFKMYHPKRNFKRRYSAGHNKYYDHHDHLDYLGNLNEISPRTRPYVPHPPSYDRPMNNLKRMPYYDDHHVYDPIYERRRASSMHANYLQRSRKVDTDHDTSLYLSTPYRSMHVRSNHNGGRDTGFGK